MSMLGLVEIIMLMIWGRFKTALLRAINLLQVNVVRVGSHHTTILI